MKVYALPDAVPFADPDYANYDIDVESARRGKHMADLKAHLVAMGYTGKHTGGVVSFGVADGCAQYMLADGTGKYGKSFLVHLPYGDSYHYEGAAYMPKTVIISKIIQQKVTA